ncbi:MAG: DNA-processing protein DprA [Arcanobacterium sp.]|nr:DNA-processing protein DprA [Arcanobacterium sp.]
MDFDSEHLAAITWSRITEGEDEHAVGLTRKFGYAEALAIVRENTFRDQEIDPKALKRWRIRLDNLTELNPSFLETNDIRVLIPEDKHWPQSLSDLGSKMPLSLWVRGNSEILSSFSISIVGMRAASTEGVKTAFNFSFDLASDFPIISGGAIGIDAAAHKGANAAGGKTIIVSAGGVERIYPLTNTEIFQESLRCGGAIISESPLGAAPQRYRFLSRNRIIAALSQGTVVIEAGWRSGALNTARRALEIGREVGVVPGSIYHPESAGSNELLRNGALAVTTSNHIRELVSPIGAHLFPLAELTRNKNQTADSVRDKAEDIDIYSELSSLGKRVYDAIPLYKFVTVNSIAQLAGLEIPVVSSELSKLLFKDAVVEQNGKWRRKS